MNASLHPGPWCRRAGFTLLEVALATFITVGLLLVVLFFYRQAERLRQDLLVESEQIAAARAVYVGWCGFVEFSECRTSNLAKQLMFSTKVHVLRGGAISLKK